MRGRRSFRKFGGIAELIGAIVGLSATAGVWSPALAAWIDAATGQPVYTIPYSSDPSAPALNTPGLTGDPNHATVAGKNLYYDKACGAWRDSATGDEVRTFPYSSDPSAPALNAPGLTGDPNHATSSEGPFGGSLRAYYQGPF
jgi:hypothetical protein